MTTQSPDAPTTGSRTATHDSFVIEREYDASPAQLFAAFASQEAKAQWFAAPDDTFASSELTLDFRVGGREINTARLAATGMTIVYDALYQDIVDDSRIVLAYTMAADGRRMSASLLTIEFVPEGDRTRLVLTEQMAIFDGLDTVAARRHGTLQLLDGLGRELDRTRAADQIRTPETASVPGRMWTRVDGNEFVAIRVFEAPMALTFRAWSSCEHISQWWGPEGWTLPVCEMDFRTGGTWFYGMHGPNGEDGYGLATYDRIVEPSLIVYTDAFTDAERNVDPHMPTSSITVQFTEANGRTTMTSRARFASPDDIVKVVGMGMVEGLTQTWDRLDAFLTRR